MKWCGIIWILTICLHLQGQEQPGMDTEQQLENQTASASDAAVNDDGWWQYLEVLKKHPLNINTATATELMELQLLTPLQIHQLIQYRKILGNLISIYELQAVPGWELSQIEKIVPYITVRTPELTETVLKKRLTQGNHSVVLRYSRTLEKSKGYLRGDSLQNGYLGDPSKFFLRYKYRFKNVLQYGVTASKDAGEPWFNRPASGFDFVSFHLFAKGQGILQSIAIGDYTINMGQGLIHWQGLSFGNSGSIMQTKKQSSVLRPYNASGSFYFHRGAAVQFVRKEWQGTIFVSKRMLDANIGEDPEKDTHFAISVLTSGYHRTQNEIADRGAISYIGYGASLHYKKGSGSAGFNMVQSHFGIPIQKKEAPYNLFALDGKHLGNYSLDYSYSFRNLHFFGETAIDHRTNPAVIHGIVASVHPKADITLLHRNIAKDYQAFYASAFTAGASVSNENGMFAGLSVRPANAWTLDFYADFFRFPWLKFRVDAPSSGKEYFIQANYRPSKFTEIYSRYRSRQKSVNKATDDSPMYAVIPYYQRSWRTQVNHRISNSVTIRHRFELLWYKTEAEDLEKGFLAFADIQYKPLQGALSMNARLQFFEADSYNSRLYAFENDVLYYYSIPVFYGKGTRYYINLRYKINQHLGVWVKWGQSIYSGSNTIGSGMDEISGNKKSEIRVLLSATF